MTLRIGIYHPDKQSINICFRSSTHGDLSKCIDPYNKDDASNKATLQIYRRQFVALHTTRHAAQMTGRIKASKQC